MVKLYLSEHEPPMEVSIEAPMTGYEFLNLVIAQLSDSENENDKIKANRIGMLKSEVEANRGRQFQVNYAQVPLSVPAVQPDSLVSFQGKGSNGS